MAIFGVWSSPKVNFSFLSKFWSNFEEVNFWKFLWISDLQNCPNFDFVQFQRVRFWIWTKFERSKFEQLSKSNLPKLFIFDFCKGFFIFEALYKSEFDLVWTLKYWYYFSGSTWCVIFWWNPISKSKPIWPR